MDGTKSIHEPLHQPWTEAACLGYAIAALENLDYKFDQIWLVVAEMRELFDWLPVDEAAAYYNDGHF